MTLAAVLIRVVVNWRDLIVIIERLGLIDPKPNAREPKTHAESNPIAVALSRAHSI